MNKSPYFSVCVNVSVSLSVKTHTPVSSYGWLRAPVYVSVWVHVGLSTFLHKCPGVSENGCAPHEPLEASMCFCMCVCVCICVFASLRLWISKHVLWMPRSAYICLCVLLWACVSVECVFMTIHCSVPTYRTVGICVHLCVCICVPVYTWDDPCWDSGLYVHICANICLWLWLKECMLCGIMTHLKVCVSVNICGTVCVCVCVCALVCVYLSMMNVRV